MLLASTRLLHMIPNMLVQKKWLTENRVAMGSRVVLNPTFQISWLFFWKLLGHRQVSVLMPIRFMTCAAGDTYVLMLCFWNFRAIPGKKKWKKYSSNLFFELSKSACFKFHGLFNPQNKRNSMFAGLRCYWARPKMGAQFHLYKSI